MTTNSAWPAEPENLHPSIWRASQLARLIELLIQQNGIGEMRLLAKALAKVASRKVVLIEPPYLPHALAFAALELSPTDTIWVKSKTTSDTLWATEQVLRSGSCGAVMYWATHVRPESLRRLHLAAQAGETLFWILRPMAAAQDASPSPLRLSLRPAAGGIDIEFL